MTRKEMITKCVEDQIARGIISADSKNFQIKSRLNGWGSLKGMKKAECEAWYKATFEV